MPSLFDSNGADRHASILIKHRHRLVEPDGAPVCVEGLRP